MEIIKHGKHYKPTKFELEKEPVELKCVECGCEFRLSDEDINEILEEYKYNLSMDTVYLWLSTKCPECSSRIRFSVIAHRNKKG